MGKDRIEGYFESYAHVCVPYNGTRIKLKGFETVMLLSAPYKSVVCSIFKTLPTLTAFFGEHCSFDEPCHSFNQFLTVLRLAISSFFFFFFLFVVIFSFSTFLALKKRRRRRRRRRKKSDRIDPSEKEEKE